MYLLPLFWLVTFVLLPLYSVAIVVHALWFSPFRHVPGPMICKITSLWLAYFDVTLARNTKIHEWHQKYGPVVLIAPRQASFSGISATRAIYGTAGRHPKSSYFDHFITYGERATFNTLDYAEHRDRRRLSFAFFQATSIYTSSIVDPIRQRVCAFLYQIEKDGRVSRTLDFFHLVNLYAFDNITRLLFGPDYCTRTIETYCAERSMLEGLKEAEVWNNLLFHFPIAHEILKYVVSRWTGNGKYLNAETELADWSTERVSRALEDPRMLDNGSLLCRLQEARTKDERPLTASWIKAEMLDNLNAAQTTVTVALTYVLWNIARNPEWQDRIRKELQLLPLQEDGLLEFSDINSTPILDACIKESYRVNPLSSGRAERVVPLGQHYDGVFLPQGTIVSTSTIAIHHTASAFPEPDKYDPSRWLERSPTELRAMEACFMPFGYGARLCLGRAFSAVEVKLLVANLLLRYRLNEDLNSRTNVESMKQLGTQDALPRGLRCDLLTERLE